jgi:hypothetical protein
MRRRVFDVLVSAGGLVIVVTLLVAGALGIWGYTFATSNVHNQLAQQQIVFRPQVARRWPARGSVPTSTSTPASSSPPGHRPRRMRTASSRYTCPNYPRAGCTPN